MVSIWGGSLNAQEICDNNLDDDNDGLIDCYDPDCYNSSTCAKPYSSCNTVSNPANSEFATRTQCSYLDGTFNIAGVWRNFNPSGYDTPKSGDVDHDGQVELIVVGDGNGSDEGIYIFNPTTCEPEYYIACPMSDNHGGISFADVDGDTYGEIFVTTGNDGAGGNTLRRYDFNGTTWVMSWSITNYNKRGFPPDLVDFDGNGVTELITYGKVDATNYQIKILRVSDGATLVDFGANATLNSRLSWKDVYAYADVIPTGFDPDGAGPKTPLLYAAGPEVIFGNRIFTVDLATGSFEDVYGSDPLTSAGGASNHQPWMGGMGDGDAGQKVSLGDINHDGNVDVVVVGQGYMTVWDPLTNKCLYPRYTLAGGGNTSGGGAACIGDVDGNVNDRPEIGVVSRSNVEIARVNATGTALEKIWSLATTDVSGETAMNFFDFEGDGKAELVYRDMDTIKVYVGEGDGSGKHKILFQDPYACKSGTGGEHPIIADIDGDNRSEIIASCQEGIRIYRDNKTPWISARSVFNQRAYNYTNINDDLSVPANPQKNHLVPYLNNYLSQLYLIDKTGNPYFPAPDFTVEVENISTDIDLTSSCPSKVSVRLKICNGGDALADYSIPVSFYQNDPTKAGATFIQRSVVTLSLDAHECAKSDPIEVPLSNIYNDNGNNDGVLYFLVNDDGDGMVPNKVLTSGVTLPNSPYSECNYTNNLYGPVNVVDCKFAPAIYGPSSDSQAEDGVLRFKTSNGNVISISDNDGDNQTVTISLSNSTFSLSGTAGLTFTSGDGTNDMFMTFSGTLANINMALLNAYITPDANYNGSFNMQISTSDGSGSTVAKTIALTFTAVNDLPLIDDVDVAGYDDNQLPITLADFENQWVDVDRDLIAYVRVLSLPSNGILRLSGVPVVVNQEILAADLANLYFEPNVNWSGVTGFNYNASDGTALALVSKRVSLTVLSQNDAPVLSDLLTTTAVNTSLIFTSSNFIVNYFDVDGDALNAVTIKSLPFSGELLHDGTPISENYEIPVAQIGQLTYVPNTGFASVDSFLWNATDGELEAASDVWVKVHVGTVNSAPTLTNFSSSMNEDNSITFSATDFTSHYLDGESNPLNKIRITSLPANGTLYLGSVALTVFDEVALADLGLINFVPDANWYGSNSFSWKATDGVLYSSASSVVTLTVSSVNDAPVINDLSKSGVESTTVSFTSSDFTNKFTDTEGNALSKIRIVSLPANGSLKLSGVDMIVGQEVVLAQINAITFVPTAGWSGSTSFDWNGSDGVSYAASDASVTIDISSVNTAPVLSAIEVTGLSYTENAIPFYITSTVAVSDDGALIESAIVSITSNFKQGEDYLKYTSIGAISGSYDSQSGVLTLRGVDTKANYQAALRTIQYFNLSDAPSTLTRTVTFSVTDGALLSNNVSRTISVVAVNDLPAFSNIESVGWNPNENTPINITQTATIEDLDDVNLEGAVARFSINYQNGQDVLSFVNTPQITGTWNAATGTMTLTGSATVDQYQDAIRSIKYTNTSDAPNTIMRTINIYVNDGDGISNLQFITITPVPVQDPPSLSGMEAAAWVYTEADGANVVTSLTSATFTITDPEGSNVVGGTVKISGNYQSDQDVLSWVTVSGISGAFDPLTGVLTLSGSTTVANYQAALRANLRYINNSDIPNTSVRTISITLADASGNSNTITRSLNVVSSNDTPSATAMNKSTGLSSTLPFTISDFTTHFVDRDNNALTQIRVTALAANGTLFLDNNSNNAVDGGEGVAVNAVIPVASITSGLLKFRTDATARTQSFSWQGYDGFAYSAAATVTVRWDNVNTAPVLTNFAKTVPENTDVTFALANFTYTDAESNPLINIQIVTLPSNGTLYRDADGDGVIDAGEATVAGTIYTSVQIVQLKFKPSTDWNGATSFSWTAQDDNGANDKWANATAQCTITITAINSAPTTLPFSITLIEDNIFTFTSGLFAYSDPESDAFSQIQISTAVGAGILFRDANGNNSVDAGETLLLNSTVLTANLGQIKFAPATDGNGIPYTTFQYRVSDGSLYSLPVVVTINVTPAQEAPIIGAVEIAPLVYTEDDPATSVSSLLTLGDSDNNFMNGATVQITGNYISGEDYLTFSNTPYITGVWDGTTGKMTLSGLYLRSTYQEALRSVKYVNSSNQPDLGTRTVTFMANDGVANSVASTRAINIIPVNDPPFLSNMEVTDLLYTENDPAIKLTSTLQAIDYDDTQIESASIWVSANYYNGQDLLSFTNTLGISGTWNAATGRLTLTGSQTIANYLLAIKTVRYQNLSENPNDLPKTISITLNDGDGNSNAATRTINIAKINDYPEAANGSVSTNEDVLKVFKPADFNYVDLDLNVLFRVKITSLETTGTLFLDANVNNVVDAGEDISLNQELSYPNLSKLKFKPIANSVGSPYTTFEFMVSDGYIYSISSYTMTINVLPLNDPPTSADFNFTINEDNIRTIATTEITFSDIEGDAFNKLKVVSAPSRGTLFNDANLNNTIDGGETLVSGSEIARSAIDNNQFKYKPVLNGYGTNYSVFQFRVSDGVSYSVTSNRVTINVTAVNDAPTASSSTLSANENVAKALSLANFGFSDVDGDLLNKVNFPVIPTAGTLFVDANSNGVVDAGETVTAGVDVMRATITGGLLKFLNAVNGYGIGYSTITFLVSDGTLYSVASSTITVDVAQMPDVTIAVSNATLNEAAGTSVVTATLSSATVNSVTVNLGFAGTAVGGGVDYSTSGVAITIPSGSTSGSVTITAVDDNLYETAVNETVIVSITSVTNGRESGVQVQTVDIIDNEAQPTASLSVNLGSIAEATSQTAIFTATLNRASTEVITVTLSYSGTASASDYTSSGTTITIAAGATTGSVSVTAVNDNLIDPAETIVADITSVVNGTENGVQQATTTITDNDVAGISIVASGGTTITSESGTTDNFTVTLTSQPFSNVVLSITSSNVSEGTVSVASLTFTPANWNVAQTVTVSGVNDFTIDGTIAYSVVVSVVDASSDDNFDSLIDQTVPVSNTDNDTAGFTITQSSGTTATSEPSTSDDFTVVLTAQPSSNVVLSVASSDASEGSVSPSTLTFTPANWNTAQTVTVTAVDDNSIDGAVNYTVTLSVVDASSDNAFDPLADQTVTVVNSDNDVAGFTVAQSSGSTSTSEGGSTDDITVVLTAQPNSNVVLSVVSADLTEGTVSATTLTFTPANWNVAQTVTVTGVDDALIDGSIAYNVTLSIVDASSDNNFDPLTDQTVLVTNIDNDTPGFTVTESGGSTTTSETATTDQISIVLNAQPNSNVVINVTGVDATEGALSSTTLTFTPANWNITQNITITGIDDALIDGSISYTLTFSVNDALSDNNFDPLIDKTVLVTNTDNDLPAFIITQTAGSTVTSESLSTDNFSVVLGAQPASNVVITISGIDATEHTLSTSTITFTSANWNTAQTITISGVDDNSIDGAISYNLTLSVNDALSDDNFDSLADQLLSVSNTDNDVAGFTVSLTGGSTVVSETGSTDNFTVVLTAQPSSDVVISLVSSNVSEGSIAPASLTFTPANWNVPQTAVVTGVDDNVIDGAVSFTITLSVVDASSDNNFDLLADQNVAVTNNDNDVAGFSIVQSGGSTSTTEVGASDGFTVVLTAQPNSNVVLTISSSDLTEGTVAPSSVTFTPANWSIAQTVNVTGVDDYLVDGSVAYTITVAVDDPLSDNNFDPLANQTVSVSNADNDVPGFTITQSGGATSTTEAGLADNLTVVLTAQPNSNVVISLVSSNLNEGTVSPASLTFTPANWNVSQTVTVTGVNDFVVDGLVAYSLSFSIVDASSDNNFDPLADQIIGVTNADNDVAGFVVTQSGGTTSTSEAATFDDFTVVLTAQPTSNVVISIANIDATEGAIAPSTLTFTSANWNVAQTVTVTGVNDFIIDGNISYNLSLSVVDASSDDTFDSLADQSLSVTNIDNDVAGFTIVESGSTQTSESGSSDSFTIVLTAQPSSNVVIDLTNGNLSEGTLSASQLTFTAANWNVPQLVTITGVNDFIVDGSVLYSVTVAINVAGSDDSFDALADKTVSVTNLDNDVAGFTLTETGGSTSTSEGATADNINVVLTAQPTSDVVIGVVSSDVSEGTVAPSALTFTSANWNIAQTITVTGVDDNLIDGSVGYNLTLSVTDALSDDIFDLVPDQLVSVSNADNDVAGFKVTQSGGITSTNEGGTSDDLSVVLLAQPNSNVNFIVSVGNALEGSVNFSTLTFTPLNWNQGQTVTVTGVDDYLVDGSISYTITIAVDDANSDNNFDSLVDELVAVTNTDNDVAGITLTPTAGATITSEGGLSDNFSVVLTAKPVLDVVVNIASGDVSEGTISPSTLTFTTANWNTPQLVMVTGVNDYEIDGSVSYLVTVDVDAALSDDGFDAVTPQTLMVVNNDDDAAGFSINKSSVLTSEAGTTDHFTVVLSAQPSSDVVITVTSGDATEGVVDLTTLTFTPLNWNVAQTVTLTGQNDALADGSQNYIITVGVDEAMSDDAFDLLADQTVAATNSDDDSAGVTVTSISGFTTEAGGSATFSVVLNTMPTADVSFSVISNDLSEGATSLALVTFTPLNWNVIQYITVVGADDSLIDGNVTFNVQTGDAVSSDINYNGLVVPDVSVINHDNDVAGVSLGSATLSVSESGGSAPLSVVLTAQPLSDVVVDISNGNPSEVLTSTSSLTFTPANWNTPQIVLVTGVNEQLVDGNQTTTLTVGVNGSLSDDSFDLVAAQTVTVTNTDDDVAGFSASVSSLTTTEASGTSANCDIVLTGKPLTNVVVELINGNTGELLIDQSQLVFTPADWNVPQTVTFTGLDDQIADGNQVVSVVLRVVDLLSDNFFDAVANQTLTVTNVDDDMPGVVVSAVSSSTSENGSTATFTVKLSSQPSEVVTFSFTSLDVTEGTLSTMPIVFNPVNWNTPQTVTVSGIDDSVIDGDVAYTISGNLSTSVDPLYNGIDVNDVVVTNSDNDVASFAVVVSGGVNLTSEDLGSDNFTVALTAQPSSNVVVNLSSTNMAEGMVSPSTLTFTPANWNTPQVVTLTGVNDLVADGTVVYSIVLAVNNALSDNLFDNLTQTIVASNTDNDLASVLLNKTSGTTAEIGVTDIVSIKLNSQPTSNVFVNVVCSDPTEGAVSTNQITFTPVNWNVLQVVTAFGVNDDEADGNQIYHLTVSVDASSDPVYAALSSQMFNLINVDDDVAGVTVTSISGNVSESGGTSFFALSLTSKPTNDVTIYLESSDLTEGIVALSSIVLTPVNWSTPQSVIITGVDDNSVDGNVSFNVSFTSVVSTDMNYNGQTLPSVAVINTDNDIATFALSKSVAQTSENGLSDVVMVSLPSVPLSNVVLDVVSSNLSEGNVLPSQLTFTPANWNVPQALTLTGVDDLVSDGNTVYTVTVSVNGALSDVAFGATLPQAITVTNGDNDSAGTSVSSTSLVTSEAGGSASFTIVLNSAPMANVSIDITSSNSSEGTPAVGQIVFTPLNWSTPKLVTINGVDDAVVDGNVAYTIFTGNSVSADLNYNGLVVPDIDVINMDNDVIPDLLLSTLTLVTSEGGISDDFTVMLSSPPSSDVVIDVLSSNENEGVVSVSQVVFTSANWNIPQTITATGVNDAVADGTSNYNIMLSVNVALSDAAYTSVSDKVLNVTNSDNDVASVTASSMSGSTSENGSSASFTLVLNSQPLSDVTIPISSSNPQEGVVPVTEVVFTSANWNVPQTITVTGVNDVVADGDITYSIVLSPIVSADNGYNTLDPSDVVAINLDDDAAHGFVVSKNAITVVEGGSSDSFSLQLTSAPTSNVVFDILLSSVGEVSVAPLQVVFTPTNWNTPQSVSLTGIDDGLVDGNQTVTVTVALKDALSDDAFDLALDHIITVTVVDNTILPDLLVDKLSLITGEGGISDNFTVSLSLATSSDVVVDVLSSNSNEGVVSTSQVIFTPINWNIPQTVTVTGVNDDFADGAVLYSVTLSVNTPLSDPTFGAVSNKVIAVENSDNDVASITSSSLSGATSENGSTATFTLVLNSQPTADVVIPISSSNVQEGQTSVSEVVFTSTNWNIPQTVIVTGVNDLVADGDATYSIVLSPIVSSDNGYNAIDPSDLVAVNEDDDLPNSLYVSNSNLSVGESGSTDVFSIQLTSAPATDVVIDVVSSDVGEANVEPLRITFNASNWNAPQLITVTGVDDSVVDGNQSVSVTVSVNPALSDDVYDVLPNEIINVTVFDNDILGLTVSQANGNTSEDGNTANFVVVLIAAPTADVHIPLSSSDVSEGVLTISELIFTPANWNTPQTVVVTGVDDLEHDGTIDYSIVLGSIVSDDLTYNGIDPVDVSVSNNDNELADLFPTAEHIALSDTVKIPVEIDVISEATSLGDVPNSLTIAAMPSHGTVEVTSSNLLIYTPNSNYYGFDSFEYTICDIDGDCSSASVTMVVNTVVETVSEDFRIPQGFSPNGDGIGDYFVIPFVDKYQQVSVEIFNRWGNVVYQQDVYQNNWNGISNVGLTIGTELPVGTYYYVVKNHDIGKSFAGDVYLGR